MEIHCTTGSITANLQISVPVIPTQPSKPGGSEGGSTIQVGNTPTGDTATLLTLLAVSLLALCGLAAAIVVKRRKGKSMN